MKTVFISLPQQDLTPMVDSQNVRSLGSKGQAGNGLHDVSPIHKYLIAWCIKGRGNLLFTTIGFAYILIGRWGEVVSN